MSAVPGILSGKLGGAVLPAVMALLLPDSEPPSREGLLRLRLEHMARLLHLRLADSDHQHDGLGLLDRLSEPVAARLLLAPGLSVLLRTGAPWADIRERLQAAAAESDESFIDAWSVNGDRWMGQQQPDFAGLPQITIALNQPLTRSLPLDLSLPAHPKVPSGGLVNPQIPSPDAISIELQHVDAAISLLDEIGMTDWTIAGRLFSQLVLRHEPMRPNICWGATSGVAIGRVLLVNVLAERDLTKLGEILLHESVHVALDSAELRCPLWATDRATQAKTLAAWPSPWSGNPLTPHALIHATVVWAALATHWRICEDRWGCSKASRHRLDVIDAGFKRLVKQETEMYPIWQALAPVARDVVRTSIAIHSATRSSL